MRVICKIKWRKKGDAGNNCQIVIFNSFLQTDHLEYAIIKKREKSRIIIILVLQRDYYEG